MNTHPILVASIADGTGKTAVTLALARLEQERGRRGGYMKPKGTRLQSSTGKTLDRDPLLARELLGLDGEIHQLEPVVYSPTFVDGAIRGDDATAAVRQADDEAVVEVELRDLDATRAAADAVTVVEYVEGTYVEGIIPGYEYTGPVTRLIQQATDAAGGGKGGTPL